MIRSRSFSAKFRSTAVNIQDIIETYDGFLIDAFGVLVDGAGVLPGAIEFIDALKAQNKPFRIVTNDSSRSVSTIQRKMAELGMDLEPDLIITSGSLIGPWLSEHGDRHRDHPVVVLGPTDSASYAIEEGLDVRQPNEIDSLKLLIVGDEAGFDFVNTIDLVVTRMMRALDAGDAVDVVVPNPDAVYPKSSGEIGIASRSVAELVMFAIRTARPGARVLMHELGKPHPMIFQRALDAMPQSSKPIMLGDQPGTDIIGAQNLGIDTLWVNSRVALDPSITPTYMCHSLASEVV